MATLKPGENRRKMCHSPASSFPQLIKILPKSSTVILNHTLRYPFQTFPSFCVAPFSAASLRLFPFFKYTCSKRSFFDHTFACFIQCRHTLGVLLRVLEVAMQRCHCLLLLLLIGFVRKKSTPLKERKGPKKDHFC